ncbi:MAG: hypothetical protein JXB04_02250 [Kiritimatiellae bacterium]|nr:hypothetical protein [Kiritimatiellia bacterium]
MAGKQTTEDIIMKNIWKTCLVIACLAVVVPARAEVRPLQLAIWHPLQMIDDQTSIVGLRLSLVYGENADLTGLDIGLVSLTDGDMRGVGLGGSRAYWAAWRVFRAAS